jgi:hypothetical protein
LALVAPVGLLTLLVEARDLLAALSSSWPGGQAATGAGPPPTSAAATGTAAAAETAATAVQATALATGEMGEASAAADPATPPSAAAGAASAGTGPSSPGPVLTAAPMGADASSPTTPAPPPTSPAASAPPVSSCGDPTANNRSSASTEAVGHILGALGVCRAAAACTRLCSSRLQLLGCANLGCTTPPAAVLGGCEASLVVNCRGSVCGGCGVVRYCSAACAQQDWPGHRRVCRRLGAVAGCRKQTGKVGEASNG